MPSPSTADKPTSASDGRGSQPPHPLPQPQHPQPQQQQQQQQQRSPAPLQQHWKLIPWPQRIAHEPTYKTIEHGWPPPLPPQVDFSYGGGGGASSDASDEAVSADDMDSLTPPPSQVSFSSDEAVSADDMDSLTPPPPQVSFSSDEAVSGDDMDSFTPLPPKLAKLRRQELQQEHKATWGRGVPGCDAGGPATSTTKAKAGWRKAKLDKRKQQLGDDSGCPIKWSPPSYY